MKLRGHHDEKGGKPVDGKDTGHTEYYDIAMTDLLETEEDLQEARNISDLALEMRCIFQDQFILR